MPTSKVYSSITKKSRQLGTALASKATKWMTKRPYGPGVHGQKRKRRPSQYGIQLHEKQKARLTYGLREKQFKGIYKKSLSVVGETGVRLLQLLETRLDNVVFRAGFAPTRRAARQLVSHGKVVVDGKKLDIPSYHLGQDQIVGFKNSDKIEPVKVEIPSWLKVSSKSKTVKVSHIPTRSEIVTDINEQLIIEFYSR